MLLVLFLNPPVIHSLTMQWASNIHVRGGAYFPFEFQHLITNIGEEGSLHTSY
jgi:hypothetical protein